MASSQSQDKKCPETEVKGETNPTSRRLADGPSAVGRLVALKCQGFPKGKCRHLMTALYPKRKTELAVQSDLLNTNQDKDYKAILITQ